MKKQDCYYYGGGYCDKAVPFTPCEIEGCVCYTPSPKKKDIKVVNELLEKTPQLPVRFKPYKLTPDDIRQIIKINYEIIFKDTSGIKCKDVAEETLRRFNQWKNEEK